MNGKFMMSNKTRLPALDGSKRDAKSSTTGTGAPTKQGKNTMVDPSDPRRGHMSKMKFPNISDTYLYSQQLLVDTCIALHGIILQDLSMGKRELLKDSFFIQGRFYETVTYIMKQQDKTLDQVMMEYEHPRLKYLRGRVVIQPKIDLVLARRKPEQVSVSALMLRKRTAGYEPDSRSVRSDMARLAYLVLERAFQWGFYLWIGPIEELRHFEMMNSYAALCEADGQKRNYIVLQKHTLVLPRLGKPIPSTFQTTLLLNRISPDFCLRLYRIEPEMTMWDDKDDDVARLYDFYSGSGSIHTGLGMWGISDQIKNVRTQLMKIRDYVEASLFDRARAMLMMARVMFTDLVVVKNLERDEIEETNYIKHHMDELKLRIEQGLKQGAWDSSTDDDIYSDDGK
ncbi:uncharacterized protein LOC100893630 [Strongylocentrotus purpuratus]|uniref:Uncharacterized protein n=1 Tax=Strongylocentrotus purpuratus TaxID=7668 RepID=A0A7M7PQV1_STRPU|nr:uncharacterized protein LOC100893630 [Strongylocentrotus purpuratus]|eukprot:XP_011683203.1 PREDICTED: uncharacterized protein LOC100893630 [Strongylocentrotus purpuratus]